MAIFIFYKICYLFYIVFFDSYIEGRRGRCSYRPPPAKPCANSKCNNANSTTGKGKNKNNVTKKYPNLVLIIIRFG